jgi:hypothetical protein
MQETPLHCNGRVMVGTPALCGSLSLPMYGYMPRPEMQTCRFSQTIPMSMRAPGGEGQDQIPLFLYYGGQRVIYRRIYRGKYS